MTEEQRKEVRRILVVAVVLGLVGVAMIATVQPSQELVRHVVKAML